MRLPAYPVAKAATGRTVYRSCALLLIISIVFQKFAIPGTGGAISLSLLPLIVVTGFLALRGNLRVSNTTLVLATLFMASTAISVSLSSSSQLSVYSWVLMLVLQAPLLFVISPYRVHDDLISLASRLGVVFAIGGLIQLALQGMIGSSIAFWFDYNIPPAMALQGFNKLNALEWDATIFKSNGIFFNEPAFFCQFLALTFLAELWLAGRPFRLIIIASGMLASYSGTGLVALAIFVPLYLLREQRATIVVTFAIFFLVIAAAAEHLQLEAITSRRGELLVSGSSGNARFVTPLSLIAEVLDMDLKTFVLGRGSGTVTEFFTTRSYDMFAPTYAKLLYEYGIIGFASYLAFFYAAVLMRSGALSLPLTFTYFVLGGYLHDPAIVTPLVVLCAWCSACDVNQSATEKAAAQLPVGRSAPIGFTDPGKTT